MSVTRKRVLIVGSGAREHAMADAIRADPGKPDVIVAPGNPGMAGEARTVSPFPASPKEASALIASFEPDLVVIGPEKPLADGLSDALREKGIKVVGPSGTAARIESSKLFAKERMLEAGIATAEFRVAENAEAARDYVQSWGYPSVLKADGLAQGKGVFVLHSPEDLEDALQRIFVRQELGEAQQTVFVEKGLSGPEVSFIALTDGTRFVPFPEARDYKRIRDGNRGPNTGGMGAVTPLAGWSEKDQEDACQIIERALWAMRRHGTPFQGFLYAGLMKTEEGLSVLEFNARFGDPEAQVLIPSAGEGFLTLLESASAGSLGKGTNLLKTPRVAVVLASSGYPEKPVTGMPVLGLEAARTQVMTRIYTAGVAEKNGDLVSSGGRVLSVVGSGRSIREARERAYRTLSLLHLEGGQFRQDIGLEEE
ncbi:MAG: phosphoribosylamine--glycine ligase [Leptospirillum sp.]